MPTLKAKLLSFAKDFKSSPFFLFQHRNVVLKKYYFILSYLKKYLHRKKAAHMCCQIMPFVGLTPFLRSKAKRREVKQNVCQCPSSGLLHFYIVLDDTSELSMIVCQCPSSGLLHFYIYFFMDD